MSYEMFNEKLQHITFILELGQSTETDTIPLDHDKEDTREVSAHHADFNGGQHLHWSCFTMVTVVITWNNQTEVSGRAVWGFFVDQTSVSAWHRCLLVFWLSGNRLSHSIALSQGQLQQQGQIHRCLWKFRSYLMGETGGWSRQTFHKLSKQSWHTFVTNL